MPLDAAVVAWIVAAAPVADDSQAIYDELNKRGVFKGDPEAQAIGHELRSRIYDRESWATLLHEARRCLGLAPFGGVDLRYRGDALGDHTLASLVWTKNGRP